MKCRVMFAIEAGVESATTVKAARKIGLECSPIDVKEHFTTGENREIVVLSPSEPVACGDIPDLLKWSPKLMQSVGARPDDKVSLFYITENQVVQVTPQQEREQSIFVARDCFASCMAYASPHYGNFKCDESAPAWMSENASLIDSLQKMLVSSLVKEP